MATTKIWDIKGRLDSLINYAANPEKTDGKRYYSETQIQALHDVMEYASDDYKTEKRLYYHYLYLFGKIRKKETRQRVSYYLREELTKFERYQKQFHFLYENDVESSGQLNEIKQAAEDKISELTIKRSKLYHKPDAKNEIADINKELKELRAKVRMCNNILEDSERINGRYEKAMEFEQQTNSKQRTIKKSNDKER